MWLEVFSWGSRVRRRQGFLRPRGAESSPVMEYMWACNGQVSCGPSALYYDGIPERIFSFGLVTPRIDPVRQEHPCYEYTAVRMCIVGGLLSLLFLFCIRVCG